MEEVVKGIPWEYIGPFGALAVVMFVVSCAFVVKMTKKKNGRCIDNPVVQRAIEQNSIMKETIYDMKGFMVDTKVVEVKQTSLLENQTNLLVNLVDETKKQTGLLERISKNGRN